MNNELEPYQINRSALIVMAKQPFVDWLHEVDPTSSCPDTRSHRIQPL
jgi:hypothetical protein